MPLDQPEAGEAEIGAIFAQLREEVRARDPALGPGLEAGALAPLPARREAQRLWSVSAERPYLYLPGWWGRLRGTLLIPVKAFLRRLMRWYVQPFTIDQRAFNGAMLRVSDEIVERLGAEIARVDRALDALDERLARLEGSADTSSGDASRP